MSNDRSRADVLRRGAEKLQLSQMLDWSEEEGALLQALSTQCTRDEVQKNQHLAH